MKLKTQKTSIKSLLSAARVPFQFFLALLFTFHIFSICFNTPPRRGYYSAKIHAFTNDYLTKIGTIQSWRMFISAPLVHKYDTKTVFTDDQGKELILPSILPGFRETGTHFKEELFFIRTTYKSKWYLAKYLEKACASASQKYGRKFVKAKLVMSKDIIQKTETIKKDKIYIKKGTYEYGETACKF